MITQEDKLAFSDEGVKEEIVDVKPIEVQVQEKIIDYYGKITKETINLYWRDVYGLR